MVDAAVLTSEQHERQITQQKNDLPMLDKVWDINGLSLIDVFHWKTLSYDIYPNKISIPTLVSISLFQ